MTREEFAKAVHWPKIFWFTAMLNPAAFLPQLYSILTTGKVEGISVPMFALFIVIQLSFMYQGYLQRSVQQMLSMGISAFLTAAIIAATLFYS
ncbi:hypothetical protein HZC00_05025 [Candidatus Kaiserbacteria bacterium]|nr:hypothetical protein [Candidatus Kaiserbacteria bacterium]